MFRSKATLALALVVGGVLNTAARADEPRAGFWERIAFPHGPRVATLLEEGERLVARQSAAAVPVLTEAVTLAPDHARARYLLARAYFIAGEHDRCADTLAELEDVDPTFVPVNPSGELVSLDFEHGLCLALAGRHAEAVPAYRQALEDTNRGLEPAILYWALGHSTMALGRLEEAVSLLRQGTYAGETHRARQAVLYFALGVALDRQGRTQDAARAIRRGLELDSGRRLASLASLFLAPDAEEDYYRGLVHVVAGRRLPAVLHLRRYLARGEDSLFASHARRHLERAGGDAIGAGDVEVILHADSESRSQLQELVVSHAPRLQACLRGAPDVLAMARVRIAPGDVKRSGAVWVSSEGPVAASAVHLACVRTEAALLTAKAGAKTPVLVQFAVIARTGAS